MMSTPLRDRPRRAWRRGLAAAMVAAVLGALLAIPSAAENGGGPPVDDNQDQGSLYAWTTKAAKDTLGYRRSAYVGRLYEPAYEQYRLCVVQREGGANYTVINSGWPRTYGVYQFLDGWKYSILDRLAPEFISWYGKPAFEEVRAKLLNKHINQWNRFWQDAAFWLIFDHGKGASNWQGGRWFCNPGKWKETGWPKKSVYDRYDGRWETTWNYYPFEGPRPVHHKHEGRG